MPVTPFATNRRAIVAVSVSMACFIANDTMVKHVSESLPAVQLIFIRGVFATALLLLAAAWMGALRFGPAPQTRVWHQLSQRAVLARAALDALATVAYLASLFNLPIANASAINMASPMFIALYAALAWREAVSVGRWLAIATGFLGVVLIVQPAADGFNAWALLCLFATLLHTGRDLITRTIALTVPSILITLTTFVAVLLLTTPWLLIQGWTPVTGAQLSWLASASVLLSAAHYMIIVAMRSGDLSMVAPFRYTGMLFALLAGWAVWGDVPNALAWAGIILLVLAGMVVLRQGR